MHHTSRIIPGSFGHLVYYAMGFISVHIWSRFLSGPAQLFVSRVMSSIYNHRWSKHLIAPYCLWHYRDAQYLLKFRPNSGGEEFRTFQDFFTRRFATPLRVDTDHIWPAEGYMAEIGRVREIPVARVKGQPRAIETVFGKSKGEIDPNDYFSNIFLHNNNYHHIHAPVAGVISRIQHIPGELLLLRPWAYKHWPSLPALTNERINVDILDAQGRTWLLSIVGGPGVATIKLIDQLKVGARTQAGQRIALFELGSTCCMISPIAPRIAVASAVAVGDPL